MEYSPTAASDRDSSRLSAEARPYRSHRFPACERCRKRKLRCSVDIAGQPCNSCRNASVQCIQPQKEQASSSEAVSQRRESLGHAHANRPAKRRQLRPNDESPGRSNVPGKAQLHYQHNLLSSFQRGHDTSSAAHVSQEETGEASGSKSTMFVGPVMAEDVQMIQNYMSSQGRLQSGSGNRVYDTVSDNPKDPVLCLTVPRRREGLSLNNRPGEKQREILEQILGPFADDVVDIYFEYVHPSFPVMDEEHFLHLYKTGNKSLSAAMVCDLLASSLIYWHRSERLRPHPRPSMQYAWNLAVAALQEEFLAPGMSTIHAALLDLNGRPTTSITGNTITSSRTVGLSHILGLNRDPQTWKISDAEKFMRIRLWWGVLIHDHWSSFAHGTPTLISRNQYDVPIPTVAALITPGRDSSQRIKSAQCFIALCMLTEILGEILPLVYYRRQRASSEVSRLLRRFETDLDNWEECEPAVTVLRDGNDNQSFGGSSSLRLGFLATKMLICRISFRNATHSTEGGLLEARQYSQAVLRGSAISIVTFLCSLKAHRLYEFWSPYSAYHIGSAALIALRCAIEASDPIIAARCKSSLMDLVHWLRNAKEQERWDLADICLATCEGPILRLRDGDVASGLDHTPRGSSSLRPVRPDLGSNVYQGTTTGIDLGVFDQNGYNWGLHTGPSVLDTQNNVNGFEYPWADLWDSF
ncbi:hypothetical protein BDZ45DRAFT_605698 [Acephala macrosclerotiorum]|nr:hypothetical protein BDZ45DRAFT_605698 [Acephala macrosclerotiorum]